MMFDTLYPTEFPGADLGVEIPDDWVDLSNRRELMPQFADPKSRLFILVAPINSRFVFDVRFSIATKPAAESYLLETNDWNEVLAYLEAEHQRRVRSLAG